MMIIIINFWVPSALMCNDEDLSYSFSSSLECRILLPAVSSTPSHESSCRAFAKLICSRWDLYHRLFYLLRIYCDESTSSLICSYLTLLLHLLRRQLSSQFWYSSSGWNFSVYNVIELTESYYSSRIHLQWRRTSATAIRRPISQRFHTSHTCCRLDSWCLLALGSPETYSSFGWECSWARSWALTTASESSSAWQVPIYSFAHYIYRFKGRLPFYA